MKLSCPGHTDMYTPLFLANRYLMYSMDCGSNYMENGRLYGEGRRMYENGTPTGAWGNYHNTRGHFPAVRPGRAVCLFSDPQGGI